MKRFKSWRLKKLKSFLAIKLTLILKEHFYILKKGFLINVSLDDETKQGEHF